MIGRTITHAFRVTLVLILLICTLIGIEYVFVQTGQIDGMLDSLNLEKILEGMLGKIPIIGDWLDNYFNLKGAGRSSGSLEANVYSQVAYALILFFTFKIMSGVRSIGDSLTSSLVVNVGVIAFLADLFETICVIASAIIAAEMIDRLALNLFSFTGYRWSTVILLSVIVVTVFFTHIILKGKDMWGAVMGTIYEMVVGMVMVSVIYLDVALTQMLLEIEYLSTGEALTVIGGWIVCTLAVTILGAKSLAGKISTIFPI